VQFVYISAVFIFPVYFLNRSHSGPCIGTVNLPRNLFVKILAEVIDAVLLALRRSVTITNSSVLPRIL
jgi:hypothetical protein